jgi:hypothetical protein
MSEPLEENLLTLSKTCYTSFHMAVTTSISLPEDLREAALRKAENEGRSFSNYVTRLVAKDLENTPQPEPTPASGN